ncbi:uncharacterized protein [Eleutherodactylus coqui]|uniref:uncharacterized protein n=1 Tax=Eleutherodactylus coqui TaxID=57060 RepID=UPI00346237DC
MKSIQLLVHICLLIAGTTALVHDIFVASGEEVVIPLDVRLEYTSGLLCNKFVWTFKGAGRFLRQLAYVSDICNKQDCKNESRPHCSLSSNGSLRLHEVKLEDAGQYKIVTYHVNRSSSTEDTFNLYVLDAVSQPVVSLFCPSDGQPVVSCLAANGSNILTSIKANGELLLESSISGGAVNYFKVSSSAPWSISCSVTNKISQKTITVLYTKCPEPLSKPYLEITCHPYGFVEIFCKTENGSEPSFSWFIDGNPVQATSSWNVTENLMSGSTNVAVNVSCSVRNVISSVQSPVATLSCLARTPHQTIQGFCKVLLFALYTILLICMIYTIIQSNKICDLDKP